MADGGKEDTPHNSERPERCLEPKSRQGAPCGRISHLQRHLEKKIQESGGQRGSTEQGSMAGSAAYERCFYLSSLLKSEARGCLGGSVGRPTWAQVVISHFMGSSPASGSVLTDQSLEPASDSPSPSLSLCPSPTRSLSLSLCQKEINIKKNKTSGIERRGED